MLVDHTDLMIERVFRRADQHFFPVDEDLTLVGIINPGDHIHQGRFSASVLAEDGKDLAVTKIKVHVFVRDDLRAEAFRDPFQL